MKSLFTGFLILVAQPAFADEEFEPLQMEDGSRTWRFVLTGMVLPQESYILDAIRLRLGRSLFCPSGWEITSREKKSMTMIINGKCNTGMVGSAPPAASADRS